MNQYRLAWTPGVMLGWVLMMGWASSVAAPATLVQSATPTTQKIIYLERLLGSVSGRRLAESDDPTVRRQLKLTRQELAAARQAWEQNQAARADTHVQSAFAAMTVASRRLPSSDATDQQAERSRYQQLRDGIDVFRQAHARNTQRLKATEGDAGRGYDVLAVENLVSQAAQRAAVHDYAAAIVSLQQAQALVTGALRGMMHQRTLVHELDLNSPEAEFDYEYRRYLGYVELIPVAIEDLAPSEQTEADMQGAAEKAAWMAAQAQDRAQRGDHPVAIRMLLDATELVRGALRWAGVSM